MRDWLINLPDELTETDLIDMVEGTLPAHREPVAIAALKAEPRLGLLVKHMRADQQELHHSAQSDADARAPARVSDAVFAWVDRRSIRELDQVAQQQAAETIPISTLNIQEPTSLELFLASPWLRRLSVAAAVLLAIGAGAYALRVVTAPTPGIPVAHSGTPSETGVGPSVPSADEVVSTPAANTRTEPENQPDAVVAGASEPRSPEKIAPVPQAPRAAPATISVAAAAELARMNRLAIVVSTQSSAKSDALKGIEGLARANDATAMDVLIRTIPSDRVPSHVLALGARPSGPGPSESGPDAPVQTRSVADDKPADALAPISPITPSTRTASTAAASPATFVASIEPTEAAMASLVAMLKAAGAAVIEFKALETPLNASVMMDAESILWWSSPPNRWARTASVPVIVERR